MRERRQSVSFLCTLIHGFSISSASHGLVADPEQGTDDLLWRAVTHNLSATPATPRRKRKAATESMISPRVYTTRELGLEDTDDELTDLEDDEDQPAPTKRARLTKSDMARMRKAEVQLSVRTVNWRSRRARS
jgi:hypothetical protein